MIKVSNPFSSVPPLFGDLVRSIAGEIDCSLDTLKKYSSDGSPYTIRPQAVIYPKNSTDIKHVISFAKEYTMPISVRGSGSARTGGSLSEGIILDMTRYFNHIRQINMMDGTITVDAGVSVKTLREKLHGMQLDIPILTAQDNESTLGALVSTKSVTPTSFCHSTIREWIEGMTIIVDTGEEHHLKDGITPSGRLLGIYQTIFPILISSAPTLRAVKPDLHDDATGYCLWNTSIGPRQLLDQLTGSEGTLGIITSVTLRVAPHKPYITTLCIPIHTNENIATFTNKAKECGADHIFLYDEIFMELVERYHLNTIPSFPEAEYALLVTFFGTTKESIDAKIRNFVKAFPLEEKNCVYYDNKYFIERVTDPNFLFSLLHSYTQGSHTAITTTSGIIVPIHAYKKILDDIRSYLHSTGKFYVVTGNAGSGHISLITLFDHKAKEYAEDIIEYTKTIFALVKKYKGGISALSGEGLSRTPFISFVYNEATLNIFKEIKNAWDPSHILNPGKKITIDLTYLKNHTSTESESH